jgi:hypothetical protein
MVYMQDRRIFTIIKNLRKEKILYIKSISNDDNGLDDSE